MSKRNYHRLNYDPWAWKPVAPETAAVSVVLLTTSNSFRGPVLGAFEAGCGEASLGFLPLLLDVAPSTLGESSPSSAVRLLADPLEAGRGKGGLS